jgi:DNA polymerase/3'-5' exonuclease PolX
VSGPKWREAKLRRPRAAVAPWVDWINRVLDGREVHVCGSWRRGVEVIGDLDVLIVTEDGQLPPDVFEATADALTVERGGAGALAHCFIAMPDGRLHVDLYGATPKQRGAFLWHLTGPADLNIAMRARAQGRGQMLNQYGLWSGDEQLDDGTEASVGTLLNCSYLLEPTRRPSWRSPRGPDLTQRAATSSDGVTVYTVTERDGVAVSCDCPGFKYRRRCRHTAPSASQ